MLNKSNNDLMEISILYSQVIVPKIDFILDQKSIYEKLKTHYWHLLLCNKAL